MSERALHAAGGYDRHLEVFQESATDQQAANRHWGSLWELWWRDRMHTEPWRAALDVSDWRVAPNR
jgi:hypothetical protein